MCALSILPAERALFLIGVISSFCSFINATSVLVTVPMVIRTKDSRSIPGPYAFANLVSSMVWSVCGFILSDPCVMMPNIFSTCCAGASLALKAFYPPREDEKLLSAEEGTGKRAPAAKEYRTKELAPIKHAARKINGGTFLPNIADAGQKAVSQKTPVETAAGGGKAPVQALGKSAEATAEGTGGTC